MSRSRRKTPIVGICGRKRSEKEDKRIANRAFRRLSRARILAGKEPLLDKDEISNVYSFTKDGKMWLGRKANTELRK